MAWLLVALLSAGVLVAGWKGAPVALLAVVALDIAWLTAAVLFAIDYRDADGFMDCWPNCTGWQDAVGFVAFFAPALLVVLLLGSLAGWLSRRAGR